MSDDTSRPPPAPPLPPALPKKQSKASSFKPRVRRDPEDWFYQPPRHAAQADLFEPPTGPYFVYGTLMDPKMLADILGLKEKSTMRPAKIRGYARKLWGQYPAMQDGPQDAQVSGSVYHVQSVAHAKRLAQYETNNYRAKPCLIQYTDGKEPAEDSGHVFMFVGNPRDLKEGEFDLGKWLKRMGRLSG
ncbi:hypothetical protein FPRO04_12110 [Fusarium proliferatum]|nr:hypothetical protein FPRO03_13474 [Fusarium proliferatum]KAG4269235.1 hypothetical protein FPRO04_12110 [Fusarium proliferatum]CVL07012.1 uncharacterized protein FPRN_13895 [Fusarium proliferatum]